jgi:hypothetical protein
MLDRQCEELLLLGMPEEPPYLYGDKQSDRMSFYLTCRQQVKISDFQGPTRREAQDFGRGTSQQLRFISFWICRYASVTIADSCRETTPIPERLSSCVFFI